VSCHSEQHRLKETFGTELVQEAKWKYVDLTTSLAPLQGPRSFTTAVRPNSAACPVAIEWPLVAAGSCQRDLPISRFVKRQATYIEARWRNHCCRGKARSFTYSYCCFVALGIRNAMRMRHIVICGLSGCVKFLPHFPINGKIFGETLLSIKRVSWFSVHTPVYLV